MLEYSFSVRHEGCWTADINDEFPDVTATILQSHAFTDSSSTMIEIDDVGEARTEEIVEWMDDHPVVRTVDLLRHGDGTGLVSFQTDYSDTDTEPVGTVFREQPCIPLSRAEVRNGFEHCHIMMANKKQIRTTYDELRDYGPVEVRSFSELDSTVRADDLAGVSRAVSGLSTRQQQVLERAIQRGYYEVPQDCKVEDLAAEESVTMSTVAEHLRHAEQKILTAVEPLLSAEDG
jgi:predicted DNA binding protein